MAATRSDSLVRSASMPAIVVVPCAKAAAEGDQRDLVDGAECKVAADRRGGQRAVLDGDVGDRLAREHPRVAQFDRRAHQLEDVEQARSRGIHAGVANDDRAPRRNRRRRYDEGRRGEIPRDLHRAAPSGCPPQAEHGGRSIRSRRPGGRAAVPCGRASRDRRRSPPKRPQKGPQRAAPTSPERRARAE